MRLVGPSAYTRALGQKIGLSVEKLEVLVAPARALEKLQTGCGDALNARKRKWPIVDQSFSQCENYAGRHDQGLPKCTRLISGSQ